MPKFNVSQRIHCSVRGKIELLAGADPENSERGGEIFLARAQHRSIPTTHEYPLGD